MILYTSPHCPPCKKLKDLMEEKGIQVTTIIATSFTELPIEGWPSGSSRRGVPCLQLDSGEVITNFSKILDTLGI